ncbi:MAG: hypothetical protein JWQ35_2049 [Bacteriovoracaceae bacterium]|nr:hypothetical protein [Bacteriovoracaceae bacterium]
MNRWPKNFEFLSILGWILFSSTGCQQKISPDNSQQLQQLSTNLNITSTSPANAAQNVALDQPILISFDQRIDSASVHPSQVEIWTEGGNKVSVSQELIGGQFVGNTSVLKIRSGNDWSPTTKYYVALRGQVAANSSASTAALAGIQSITGAPLSPTSLSFTTGTDYLLGASNGAPQVTAITPGLVFKGGGSTASSTFATDLVGATTVVPNNDIKINFSTAIKHPAVDPFDNSKLTTEIPPTSTDIISGMIVATLDSGTPVSSFISSIPDAATHPAEWQAFLQSALSSRLKGTVHTENSRKLLVFQLDPSSSYPDNGDVANIAQVVIVIVQGFVSVDQDRPLLHSPVVGGFVHISSYKLDTGFTLPSVTGSLGSITGLLGP